jgi:polysaccharide deacetylase family protein (PEP-CTERM system associated)
MNILTFDLEDWFHVLDFEDTKDPAGWPRFESRFRSNADRILSLLDEKKLSATFFCLGWIAERHPDIIRRIVDQGHEIASHSYSHQLIYKQSPQHFEDDLLRSINLLQDISGCKIRAYRAPGFSMTLDTLWAYPILAKHGIEIDCSMFPASRGHGGIDVSGLNQPAIMHGEFGSMKFFPMTVRNLPGASGIAYAGGGYFRLLPWIVIRKLMRRSAYNMTYFHPRDFDPDQPRLKGLGMVRHFKSYVGLAGAYRKLLMLLADFEFVNLQTAAGLVDWGKTPVITLSKTGLAIEMKQPS